MQPGRPQRPWAVTSFELRPGLSEELSDLTAGSAPSVRRVARHGLAWIHVKQAGSRTELEQSASGRQAPVGSPRQIGPPTLGHA